MISCQAVRVDINNADVEGFIRLVCVGTEKDLARLGITLMPGLAIVAHDGEIEFHGIVHASGTEGIWRLEVDWQDISEKHARL